LLDASQSQAGIYKQDINGDQHPPSQFDASQNSVAGFLQKSGAVRLAGKLNRQLLDAVDKNDLDMAGALLDKGADPNHFGHTGGNVLMRASAQGNMEMIKLLLAKGSNPNMGTVSDVAPMVGRTALFFAAEKGQTQAAKLLIDQGAKVNTRTKGGTTALMVAAEQAKGASAVKVLLDAGADVNAKRSDGATAIVLAAGNGSVEAINYLLGAGADTKARLKEGDALTFAAGSGRADNLTVLLKQPFSQSSKDDALLVAVQYAASFGRPEAVKVLLQNGADPNVKNANGVSAIQSTAGVGNDELVKLLKASGAKDNPKGYDSKTGAARPPADPATMTKAQWIELIAPFNASSRKFTSAFLSEAAFKKKFGAPVKTQRVGDSLFWYYQCSDGTLQVVVDADFLDQQGVVIKSVNEF
jgi:ankyrin repeat protein